METSRLHFLLAAALAATLTLAACGKKEETVPASMPEPVLMRQAEPATGPAPTPAATPEPHSEGAARQARELASTAAKPADHPPAAANGGGRAPASVVARNGMAEAARAASTTAAPRPAPRPDLGSYSVDLRATEHMQMWGTPGQMRVWIGDPQYIPPKDEGMVEKTMPLGVTGLSARVDPFVQGDISVDPAMPQCGRIVPSGSEFLYNLIPHAAGSFTVGARIDVFDSPDCTGATIPKGTKSIAVEVQACWWCLLVQMATELLTRTWHAFLEFWDKLLLLFFGLLLILLRKKIARWFGLKPKDGPAEK